jgi:outer membrane protein assembly factor BamB
VLRFIVERLEKAYFIGFLYGLASAGLLILLYFGWWWANRRIRLADRLYGFVVILSLGAAVAPLVHPSVGGFGLLMTGVPVVLTVWTLWMFLVKTTGFSWYRLGSLAVVALAWGWFTLVRIDGLDAELQATVRWRWEPSAEELFLAEKASAADAPESPAADWTPSLTPNDWTAFRGPNRDGVIRGVTIATDWDDAPPKPVWRQRVGPAWSSMIVLGDRLFTQEQRGQQETVVCYDALTGKELWVHTDTARFWETVSGAGPRATPTYADGRIYTLGGTGILNCLDAATGKKHWSRDIAADAAAKPPMWGYSGSPLVVDGLVVAFAGGESDKSLLAYRTDSGELAWTAPAGPGSYSSPQLATIAGKPQCLFLSDRGLTAVDPATGTVLWMGGVAMPGAPRCVQPHIVGATQLVAGTLEGPGVAMIDVIQEASTWKVAPRWATKDMKPEFPDFVVHQGYVYGFDTGIFCCINLATGKRSWRGGRYGRGQVVLLADQSVLLVLSETGEAVLLAANPRQHEELGRFQALDGKTWNHPIIAHGRLYARNAEEMACYELRMR